MQYQNVAFIGWNPFQFRHIEPVAKLLPQCFFVVEERKNNNIEAFQEDFFKKKGINIITWPSSKLSLLDGVFDVLVCQVVFPGIEKIKKSKIVFVQYGYAKDPHNYGIWRGFGELNCTYGPYATKKVQNFSRVVETGNPEIVKWNDSLFIESSKSKFACKLDSKKRTLLYAPTWGDLSSVELYLNDLIHRAGRDFNIILKLHHNTDLIEKSRQYIKSFKNIYLAGANDDIWELLAVSDALISDYSGAIFDGVYAEKPIVLLNIPDAISSKKEDMDCLEFKHRDEIGIQVNNPEQLDDINSLIIEGKRIRDKYNLKSKLYSQSSQPDIEIKKSIELVLSGVSSLPEHRYLKSYLQKTYEFFRKIK